MDSGCFKYKELIKPSFFQNLFKTPPKENAFIEINNLLAKKDIKDITYNEVASILHKYMIPSLKDCYSYLEKMYEEYLTCCLSDKLLSDDEIERLKHLKTILFLNDKQVSIIHNKVAGKIYEMEVEQALSDAVLSDEEKNFLRKLKNDLKLDDEIADRIYTEMAKGLYQRLLDGIMEDERLSPKEEKVLVVLAQNLGLKINLDEQTKSKLARYKVLWYVENGYLPELEVNIHLMKKEKCHFKASYVDLYETRKVTKRIKYAGPTARIKIVKGVYWRMGDLGVKPVSKDVLTHIDTGKLYLTSKRLIFYGDKKVTTIRLQKIIDFHPYSDGVKIIKDTGKSPVFEFSGDIELFSLILSRLLQDI